MTGTHPLLRSALIGLGAGGVIVGLMYLVSVGWMGPTSYNDGLWKMRILHLYGSSLLVLFFAGCCTPFVLPAGKRKAILLHAALAGLIAAAVVRFLPPYGNPPSSLSSFLATWPQLAIILGTGLLASAAGGLFASFIRRDGAQGVAPLLPVAVVVIAAIILPPLLGDAVVSTGIIPPSADTGGFSVVAYGPTAPTDLRVLKLSPEGDPAWERTVDIGTYDGADVLTEYAGGYALTTTEYGQNHTTVHPVLIDREGTVLRQNAITAEFPLVSAFIAAPDGGFLIATGASEIIRINSTGVTVRTTSLTTESPGMAPVSLLARDDGTVVVAWANRVACMTDDGSVLWDVTPASLGSGPSRVLLSPAGDGGVLLCTEGRQIQAGEGYAVHPVAVRLGADGTVLWEKRFGSGGADTLLGTWQNGSGHAILYRTTTYPTGSGGRVVPAYTGHLLGLDENGTETGLREVPDTGGAVIPSPGGGYLQVDVGETALSATCYDAGGVLWTNHYDVRANPMSVRGTGTADGGYLIAVSSPS
ncbi:hypothetical protein AZH53_09830 [Methanomicrobiaceae archaeon CYW5]|uniref:hypothetical protein n=1 Tax=Methanovulcanius yangii TaxID=1789227 RepID=UPI0029C9D78C|nr:hypothetical protein [Methanovulcanius yangii]MBT8508703.1 hypothetical protein [Methanovulcanius yangii]